MATCVCGEVSGFDIEEIMIFHNNGERIKRCMDGYTDDDDEAFAVVSHKCR